MRINLYTCNYYSEDFLETNYQLIKQVNPNMSFRWLISNHTPKSDENKIIQHDEMVIYDNPQPVVKIGSIPHGQGLNYLMKSAVKNKYFAKYHIVIDPDFYVFQSFEKCIHFMNDKNIDIFGATYCKHACRKLPMLYKYPASFFQIFDDSFVDIKTLDFGTFIHKSWRHLSYVPEVGHRIAQRMEKGEFSYYTLQSKDRDIYCFDEDLFAIHIHTLRGDQNTSKAKMKLADNRLSTLEQIYEKVRSVFTINIDFTKFPKVSRKIENDKLLYDKKLPKR